MNVENVDGQLIMMYDLKKNPKLMSLNSLL